MALEVRWTRYGGAAARALHDAVAAAKAGNPLEPVTVVVPSNHVGVASRRMLASGQLGPVAGEGVGVAAVTFVTPYRLAELLAAGALAAQGKRPVSTPVLAAAVRAELAVDAGIFGPVREHPATESALVATYRELRDCSSAALDALARTGARAAEVVRLHRAVRARLAPAWSDEEDLLDAATALVGSPAVAELGAIVVHLPQRLTQHAARFLAALGERTPVIVIAGATGDPAADAEVATSLARLGVADAPPPDLAAEPLPVDASRTRVVTTSDADEEVRAAVRAVVGAVREGTRLDRIALLHASPEPYARLAHEQLHAAGIATNGASVVPLAARMAGRTILDLLELPHGRFRRQDVFAWLSSAPMVVGDRWTPTTAWERASRDAAVVAGRGDWDVHLEQLAQSEEHQAALADQDDEQPDWVAERSRATAARARQLRGFVLGVIDDLARAAAQPRRWSQHAEWAKAWLVRLLGPAARREDWPLDERRAAERIEVALDRLGALDGVEGPVPLDVFARTLAVELDNDLGRVGRFGDGVLVGSVDMGTGVDLDLVIVLGLAEGSFPSPVRDDSLLPDRERAAAAGELALRADRVDRQHRQLLACLAGAGRQLLCVPRGDLRRSTDRFASRWVLDIVTALARQEDPAVDRWWAADLDASDASWIEHVPSFDAGLRQLAVPATAQEHRLRAVLAGGGSLAEAGDPATAAGAEVLEARRSRSFTRFDGNLAGLPVESPRVRTTSPTRLERWAHCPHRHLVEDLLHAAPVENPEEALAITPIHKGNLVHEALERFLLAVLARPEGERPTGRDPWTPEDHRQLEQIGAALCDQYEALGLTGRPIFWRRDRRRILNDLGSFLLADSWHRLETGTSPLAAELAFGFDGADPVAVDLPGGLLRVRGRIDRVDRAADGTVHVIDYKTGSAYGYDDLDEDHPVACGTKLQLPLYGLAGRALVGDERAPVHAEYWFVTSRGRFQRIGYDVTDAVLDRTREVLGVIVSGVEDGVFPPHPSDLSTFFRIDCHVCNPDGLGTAELRKQWERKRDDPALAAYAALAEPPQDGDEEQAEADEEVTG